MSVQFSSDGQYFAFLSTEGKLKIWNAVTGSFEQEYSPNYHLSCPCTCLQFINSHSSSNKVLEYALELFIYKPRYYVNFRDHLQKRKRGNRQKLIQCI